MSSLLSVFKNGGPNYSYGRVFSGLIVAVGLLIACSITIMDAYCPDNPVIMTRWDPVNHLQYQESVMVRDYNLDKMQSLLIGLAAFAGTIYGITKVGDTVGKFGNQSNNGGGPAQ